MKTLFIKKILIKNFRNIDNLEIYFIPNKNEITGSNATGKSSILDAILYILFHKNYENKIAKNIKKINIDSTEVTIFPFIEMVLNINENTLKLSTKNDKWYIDDIEQKNKTTYIESLFNRLDIGNESLFTIVNPSFIENNLIKENKDKEELRNNIITIANSLSNFDHKISSDEIQNLFDEIKEKSEEINNTKKSIKDQTQYLNNFKTIHDDIKSWEISDKSQEDLSYSKKKIDAQIERFKKIQKDIENLNDERSSIKNKSSEYEREIENSNKYKSNEDYDSQSNKRTKKDGFLKRLFNFLFGWIKKIFKKSPTTKPKNETVNNVDENFTSIMRKEDLENNSRLARISEIDKELNELVNNYDYRNVNLELLKSEQIKLENSISDLSGNNDIIINYKNLDNDLKKTESKCYILQEELLSLKSKKVNFVEKINKIMKTYFHNFEIDLFKDDGKDSIVIKQNGIIWNYLNNANKKNILYAISDFLEKKFKINSFILIDNAESLNDIFCPSNKQVIFTKVNYDKHLAINGKIIN